jgi:hypothetical protein
MYVYSNGPSECRYRTTNLFPLAIATDLNHGDSRANHAAGYFLLPNYRSKHFLVHINEVLILHVSQVTKPIIHRFSLRVVA